LTSNDRWAPGLLYRKLVNFAGEVNTKALQDTNLVKKLTGGSLITAEFKNKPHFQYRNYAKIICSSNDLPESPDKTIAWYSRFYPIFLPNVFRGSDREVKNIADKITDEEIEAFFNKLILEILPELMKRDWAFSWDPSTEELEDMYEELSNPLHKFVKTFFDRDPDGKVPKFVFRDLYEEWCKKRGYKPKTDLEIKKYLIGKFGCEDRKPSYDYDERVFWLNLTNRSEPVEEGKSKQYPSWIGIKLKNIRDIKDIKGCGIYPLYRGFSSADTLDTLDMVDISGTENHINPHQNSNKTLDMVVQNVYKDHAQAERLKAILSTIKIRQKQFGTATIEEIKSGLGSALKAFLEEDLEYLKQQGKIFEPKPGHYRLVED